MRTLGPAVAEFFAANLKHTKGELIGRPFILESWQRDDIDLIFELDDEGRRKWRTVLWMVPRGNGKSPVAAGFGLFELVDRQDAPEILCAAAAKEQAGIVHDFAHGMPKNGPLADYIEFPRSRRSPLLCPHNGGIMRTISADGDLQHGLMPSVSIIDELHVFKTNKQEELVYALLTAMQKRSDSVTLIITTAGPNKASLLGEKFDAMLKTHELEYSANRCRIVGRHEASGSLLIYRGAPDDADVTDQQVWRDCNPASWIPLAELERLSHEVPESVFRRLVLNQWVVGHDAAIQPASWDACCKPGQADIEDGADVWLGVDIGERRDMSSVSIIAPLPNGDIRVQAKVFNPEKENLRTLLPLVESAIRQCAGNYIVRGVAFDPWQFRRSADLLSSDGIRMMEVTQQERYMVPASQNMFDLIEQQKIIHNGDEVLRQHVLAAEAKQTSRGTWRFVKPLQSHGRRVDESQKVDALIAVTIAVAAYSMDEKTNSEVWAEVW